MKITYLGTAAAEAIPSAFCRCPVCVHARKNGGREIRGRSGVAVGERMMIDIPPDIVLSSLRAGADISNVETLLVTHTHEDHLDVYELSNRCDEITSSRLGDNTPLTVAGSADTGRAIASVTRGGVRFELLPLFTPTVYGDIEATALPAEHIKGEDCRIYLLKMPNGAYFLYGHDTGLFPDAALDYLRGIKLDAVSLDCTFVMLRSERGHMGIDACEKQRDILISQGSADSSTRFIVNHFSHNGFIADGVTYTTGDFERIAADRGFEVAYDGMQVEL
ncbi:MAG: MBL fold metallo-hydrolase [Eubacteriales bacterium]